METISKKELLELTGISYGQLYRWKREKLIPEAWFMKQSSYTGQETFFPKEQMVGRVKAILELKDDYSLDEMSRILEPDVSACIYREDLDLVEEINGKVLEQALHLVKQETFRLSDVAFLIMISEVGSRIGWSDEIRRSILERSLSGVIERKNGKYSCVFFLSNGTYHMVCCDEDSGLKFDSGISVLETAAVGQVLEKIRNQYSHLFH